MLGRIQTSRGFAAACAAAVLAAAACGRDGATTGPSGLQPKDFAANLRLVSGDQQLGPITSVLSQPISVRVVDAGGQPVQGATVTFAVRAGGGSINPAANVSGSDGIVAAVWTMGNTLGAAKAVATLTNVFVLDSAVFTATATTGPGTDFKMVSGDNQTSNVTRTLPAPLVVRVRDAFGNPVSGIKVTWSDSGEGTITSVGPDTTAADGTASATWTLGRTAGQQNVTASLNGGTPSYRFTAVAAPDTGRAFTLLRGNGQNAGVSSTLTGPIQVMVTDQYGNPVSGASVTWNDSLSGGGSMSATASATAADGTASVNWTLGGRLGAQFARVRLTGRSETVTVNATATVSFWEVYAGNFMACAVETSQNNVYCWGAGDDGQLGKGTLKTIPAPTTPVSIGGDSVAGPFLSVRQLTGGRNSYCALSVSRKVYCWGRAPGQAGTTNTAAVVNLVDPRQQVLPALVAAGQEHLCVLDLSGIGFCTGTNWAGQLGDGTNVSPAVGTYPFVGTPPPFTPFSTIAAGKQHTCAFLSYRSFTMVNNRVPQCWGLNDVGQVGNGTTINVNVPTTITLPPLLPMEYDTTSLAVGGSHTCVLDKDGNAYCWGSNGFGQLGNGAVASSVARDTVIKAVASGGTTFKRIFAGEYHTCAISTSGTAYCWGRNDYGQLGDGTNTNATTPVAVAAGNLKFRSLSVGELFTCGVVSSTSLIPGSPSQTPGTVYCWGDNLFGELGQNATGNSSQYWTPKAVKFQAGGQP